MLFQLSFLEIDVKVQTSSFRMISITKSNKSSIDTHVAYLMGMVWSGGQVEEIKVFKKLEKQWSQQKRNKKKRSWEQ